jgi:nitrogen regulatory protein PII
MSDMSMARRKLVTVVCEAALESRLAEAVMQLGAHGYTVTEARGRGSRGVRNAAWDEAANIRLEAVCEEPVARRIAEHLQQHYYDNYAMILYCSDVEVLRPEKF